MWDFPLLPERASNFAVQVDLLYFVLIGISLFFTIPVVFLIFYFAVKYRRGSDADRSNPPGTDFRLEFGWIALLLILGMGTYLGATDIYIDMFRPPQDSLEVYVVGRQWMWKFQHPTGQREINELHIPAGRPVKLIMTSEDVIHDLFVPAFRIKRDVLPGRYTTLWFEATQTGAYHIFCAEYCGTEHAEMTGQVVVMEPADYQAWLTGGTSGALTETGAPLAEVGEQLFQRLDCDSCHRPDGSGRGPSLVGVFGSEVRLESGQVVTADEDYIRESILDPHEKIVAGYEPIMPSYEGQVSEVELQQLVAYISSLSEADGDEAPEQQELDEEVEDEPG
ncbi:MAG TPA: cytochrome c oxidase subunit II, partial [Anaerolineae bacterium]